MPIAACNPYKSKESYDTLMGGVDISDLSEREGNN